MAKRQNRNRYVGNTPGLDLPPKRKRKGSGSTYKVPKEAKQLAKDKKYMAFQQEPRLNQVTADLHIRQICDTIIGGDKVWLKGERRNKKSGTIEEYKFPIIVGGTRCENPSVKSRTFDEKKQKRCACHSFEEWWIPNEEDES